MKLKNAQAIRNGKKTVEDLDTKTTIPELVQLMMGACLTDDGTIICLKCGLPNECCSCET